MSVRSVDPRAIDDTLKEAVVDSLLNGLNARVSGTGEFHREILGARPSRLLMSGFLVPRPAQEREADEEADPMQISAHGLDFQIDQSAAGTQMVLRLEGSIYVRVMPNEADVRPGGALRPIFPMHPAIKVQLKERFYAGLEALRGNLGLKRGDERRSAEWAERKAALLTQINADLGLAPQDNRNNNVEELEDTVESREAAAASEEEPLETVAHDVVAPPGERLRDDVYDEVAVPEKWLRLDLVFPPLQFTAADPLSAAAAGSLEINAAIEQQLHGWYHSDGANSGQYWGYRRRSKVLPSELGNWPAFLARMRHIDSRPALPRFDLRWNITATRDPLRQDRLTIHAAIENWTEQPSAEEQKQIECALFGVSVRIDVSEGLLRPLTLDRVKPSYRYNKYLHYPALGFNGGVIRTREPYGDRLSTTWTPRYVLPRIVPSHYAVELRFSALAEPAGLQGLMPLATEYANWLEGAKQTPVDEGLEGPKATEELAQERIKLNADARAWSAELESLKVGIDLLTESAAHWSGPGLQKDRRGIPCEAWLSMNAAMRQVGGKKYDSWRLFQLAFIVSMVPTFATRMPEYRSYFRGEIARQANAVTLLYFATGGGKSEAFLGLLLFVLFLDRLRGKERGVSALMRYPLRLLTLQQARRTMVVLAAGEHERFRRGHPGEPFSLGFWVGSANTPNWHKDEGMAAIHLISAAPLSSEESIQDTAPYSNYRRQWLKLEECPFCRSAPIALRRMGGQDGGTLGHFCTASRDHCEWNARFEKPTPLPFYIVDEDIYALAPSVLLGTVDKLAVIGQSFKTIRRVFGMFGFAPYRHRTTRRLYTPIGHEDWQRFDADQYEQLFPSFAEGRRAFFDSFPALLIQDEAHLLEESLGTFAGLFESALEAALDRLAIPLGDEISCEPGASLRRRVKVIAASATVSEPTRQMRNLYQRDDTQQFPHPGPDLYTSFYARPKAPADTAHNQERLACDDVELRSHGARVYAAILTNGHRHTVAMASILGNYHFQITYLYEHLRSADPEEQAQAREFLIRWVSAGRLQPVFTHALRQSGFDSLLSLIDLHRIALTYVTNKKGGDQVIDTERVQFDTLHRASGYASEVLLTRLISGAVSASDIQSVVREAESRVLAGSEFPNLSTRLRSIIATSAVSHGVDVEEFNAMFFAGLPSDIAEYIQASSRVGRTHVGFSLLVPVPQRHRDRFVIEIFDIFHRFLERMVLPAAVDRWADKAIRRVLPSIMQEYLCGVSRILEFCAAPDDRKSEVRTMRRTNEVNDYLQDKGCRDDLAKFLVEALGLHLRPPPEGEEYYRALLRRELNGYRQRMEDLQLQTIEFRRFFEQIDSTMRPMTSLRDVDEPGLIIASQYDVKGLKSKRENTALAMEFIRRGVASELGADGDNRDDD